MVDNLTETITNQPEKQDTQSHNTPFEHSNGNEHFHSISDFIASQRPEGSIHAFCPGVLSQQIINFKSCFPGTIAYAVKANDSEQILANMLEMGLSSFDVASPHEIALLRRLAPKSELYYHNPVKSKSEISFALESGVRCFSVDCAREIEKIADIVTNHADVTLAVRFKMDTVKESVVDFTTKFGVEPEAATQLLKMVSKLGFRPALTFHPGSQCKHPSSYTRLINAAKQIVDFAEVELEFLDIGGGFPAYYNEADNLPSLKEFTEAISQQVKLNFGDHSPKLVCEPGRGMVADCVSVICQVKLVEDDFVFISDGIYGSLLELWQTGMVRPVRVISSNKSLNIQDTTPFTLFGPTCDPLDRLPGKTLLPKDIAEGDWLVFDKMGAYGRATATKFNGYGPTRYITVDALS